MLTITLLYAIINVIIDFYKNYIFLLFKNFIILKFNFKIYFNASMLENLINKYDIKQK